MQVSGTRLQAFAWSSEQGPTVYGQALYDTERGEFCSFRRAQDGSYRCFPIAVAPQIFAGNAECPEPLAATGFFSTVPRPLWPPRYAEERGADCLGEFAQIYELGAEVARGSACTIDVPSSSALYQRGPRIPDDAFVRAELVVSTAAGDPLGGQYFVAADGSSQWFTLFDPAHGEACLNRMLNDGVRHCVPLSTLSQVTWSSSTAIDPAVCWRLIAEGNSCRPSVFGLTATEMHRAVPAADVAGTSFDTPAFRECLTSAREFMREPYALTEAVDADEFPRLVETEVASGMLKRNASGSADASVLEPAFDSVLTNGDYHCSLDVAVDGKVRCLPTDAHYLFADSACSELLLIVPDPLGGYVRNKREDGRTAVYAPGEPFSGEVYTKGREGSRVVCETSTTPLEPPQAFHRGVEVAPEQFVEYTQVILRE